MESNIKLSLFLKLSSNERKNLTTLDLSDSGFANLNFLEMRDFGNALSECEKLVTVDFRCCQFSTPSHFNPLIYSIIYHGLWNSRLSLKHIWLDKEQKLQFSKAYAPEVQKYACEGDIDTINYLGKLGVDMNHVDNTGHIPLSTIVIDKYEWGLYNFPKQMQILECLLQNGANVFYQHKSKSILKSLFQRSLTHNNKLQILSKLLAYGAGLAKEGSPGLYFEIFQLFPQSKIKNEIQKVEILYIDKNKKIITTIAQLKQLNFEDKLELIYTVPRIYESALHPEVAKLIHEVALMQREVRQKNMVSWHFNTLKAWLLVKQHPATDHEMQSLQAGFGKLPIDLQLSVAAKVFNVSSAPTFTEYFEFRRKINITPLHKISGYKPKSSEYNHVRETVETLLKQGASVTAKDGNGLTPIQLAIYVENFPAVCVFAKHDLLTKEHINFAISNNKSEKSRFLFNAFMSEWSTNVEMIAFLFKSGALVEDHYIRLLKKEGEEFEKNFEIKRKVNITPLHEISARNVMPDENNKICKAVENFLNKKEDPTLQDGNGLTPVHLAIYLKNFPVTCVFARRHLITREHIMFAMSGERGEGEFLFNACMGQYGQQILK